MKKIFLFMAMALSSVTLFSQIVLTRGGRVLYDIALEDADSITFVTNEQGELLETLSPMEQQAKLNSVATDFLNMFKPKEQRNLIELLTYLADKYEDYDFGPMYEHYEENLPFLRQLARGVRKVVDENLTHNLAMEVYDFPRFTGIFEVNDEKRTWEYLGESENIELRFKNKNGDLCVAVLSASGEEMEVEFETLTDSIVGQKWVEVPGYEDLQLVYVPARMNDDYTAFVVLYDENGIWYSSQYYGPHEEIPAHYEYQWFLTNGYYENEYYMQLNKVLLPSNIKFSLKEADKEHVALTMNFDIDQKKYAKYDMDLRVANFSVINNVSISTSEAHAIVVAKVSDKPLLSVKVSLPSYVLMGKSEEEGVGEWFEGNKEKGELMELFRTEFVFAEVDVINQLQLKASSPDLLSYYRGFDKLDRYYEEKASETDLLDYRHTYDYNQDKADWWNKKLQVGLFYNTPVQQAELQVDLDFEERAVYVYDNGVEDEIYIKSYESNYVVYFPYNGTVYSLDDYFSMSAFESLFRVTGDLFRNYLKLLGFSDWGDLSSGLQSEAATGEAEAILK
ncbi:MAG: hypothetical protein IKV26_04970 [Paludibacteraceae bacterium]|nr:hypothetical protein [Paludibacteraceae bacterium]